MRQNRDSNLIALLIFNAVFILNYYFFSHESRLSSRFEKERESERISVSFRSG